MFRVFHFKLHHSFAIVLLIVCATQGQDEHQSLRKIHKPCAPGESDALHTAKENVILPSVTGETQFCANGFAAGFPCDGVDLQSFLNISDLGGSLGSFGAGYGLNE